MLKTLLSLFIITTFLVANENNKCIVPNILLKTIKITENELSYPYYIRTNSRNTMKKFNEIIESFDHKKTKDTMLVDCLNSTNCINMANRLIENKITNLDLGLFQINYNSFKYPMFSYFDKNLSYKNACKILEEKIKINKGKWDWQVLASYHSMTPKYNKVYKEKLIKNYIKLTNNDNYSPSHYSAASKKEVEDVLVMQ